MSHDHRKMKCPCPRIPWIRKEENGERARSRLSYLTWFSYGVGHVLNDLCASMWFTYLLVFYHYVIRLPNTIAGTLVLIGQVADALSTPFCGYECDRTRFKWYGRRKLWHLIGTVCVAASVFFIYHECITCTEAEVPYKVLYFSSFIIVFQFGWASTQIAHLSLIPELTSVKSERVGLNAIRYFFTIMANLSVFLVMLALLKTVGGGTDNIAPQDKTIFWTMAVGIIIVGLCFSLIFHLGVRETPVTSSQPPSTVVVKNGNDEKQEEAICEKQEVVHEKQEVVCEKQEVVCEKPVVVKWYQWFKNPQLYLIGIIYMSARLVVNLTQLYSPFFVLESIVIGKQSVAIAPLVIFISSLLTTLVIKYVNAFIGRYMTFFIGLVIIWGALMWCWLQPASTESSVNGNIVYGAMFLIGAGGTTLLVTALSFISDMIGKCTSSGAFVYGLMSFADKLSNGITIQVIQLLHPCKGEGASVCCEGCHVFYREVIVYFPGGASFIALGGLALLLIYLYIKRRFRKKLPQIQVERKCTCPGKCLLHVVQERECLLNNSS